MVLGSIILKYILISILISIIFGITVLSHRINNKINRGAFFSPYLFQLWSLLIFIAICFFYKPKIEIFETSRLFNWNNILLIIVAVIPASTIVSFNNKYETDKPFKSAEFINGASMEIPQRLLVQNMFVILNVNIVSYHSLTLAILLNSFIWVQFIIVQQLILGGKITKEILLSIIASAWFSIWVGLLYSMSGNIVISMIAHGLERMAAHYGKVLMCKK